MSGHLLDEASSAYDPSHPAVQRKLREIDAVLNRVDPATRERIRGEAFSHATNLNARLMLLRQMVGTHQAREKADTLRKKAKALRICRVSFLVREDHKESLRKGVAEWAQGHGIKVGMPRNADLGQAVAKPTKGAASQ